MHGLCQSDSCASCDQRSTMCGYTSYFRDVPRSSKSWSIQIPPPSDDHNTGVVQMRFHEDPRASRFKILMPISCKLTESLAFDPLLLRQSDPLPVSPVPSRKDSQYANPDGPNPGVWESPYSTSNQQCLGISWYHAILTPMDMTKKPQLGATSSWWRPESKLPKRNSNHTSGCPAKIKHKGEQLVTQIIESNTLLMCPENLWKPTHMLGIENLNLPFASICSIWSVFSLPSLRFLSF